MNGRDWAVSGRDCPVVGRVYVFEVCLVPVLVDVDCSRVEVGRNDMAVTGKRVQHRKGRMVATRTYNQTTRDASAYSHEQLELSGILFSVSNNISTIDILSKPGRLSPSLLLWLPPPVDAP